MATVLIAEDDPFNRDILCDLLESEGHTVVMAASAQAAVDAAASPPAGAGVARHADAPFRRDT